MPFVLWIFCHTYADILFAKAMAAVHCYVCFEQGFLSWQGENYGVRF